MHEPRTERTFDERLQEIEQLRLQIHRRTEELIREMDDRDAKRRKRDNDSFYLNRWAIGGVVLSVTLGTIPAMLLNSVVAVPSILFVFWGWMLMLVGVIAGNVVGDRVADGEWPDWWKRKR
jgi:F0F1-type ATP synthase assembly protein I